MKKVLIWMIALSVQTSIYSQQLMTPELLWELGRITPVGISKDGKSVVYKVSKYDVQQNEAATAEYLIPVGGGPAVEIRDGASMVPDRHISPDGQHRISVEQIKLQKIYGKDYYTELGKSDVMIFDDLMYRHWDSWEDGRFSHLIMHRGNEVKGIDLMKDEPFNCPQSPFGDESDYTWSPDSKHIVYVAKKKTGKEYAVSTNTDLYSYELSSGKTTNLTKGMMGYDTHPVYSGDGTLAWLSMKTDGYEADKNDLIVYHNGKMTNLTQQWDGTVNSFVWSEDGTSIFFNAPVDGTIQLFMVRVRGDRKTSIQQVTRGDFDIRSLVGWSGAQLIVSRTDMNHATELFGVNVTDGFMRQITHVNDPMYASIKKSRIERRYVKTTDDKDMLVWVIYPPDFDPEKKYPTLLYCQGGPQSSLSQFYSFRWNFQLMAAQGYIVVAPNRRGMPGHGVEWNEAISGDYGGQPMNDYLSAIDALAREPFVDNSRLAAVGASFGGYSVFYLAGIHKNRFKSFIAHDGIFNMRSMYGTTEELFFVNWDNGGPYWEEKNEVARRTYSEYNPINLVNNWDTPILIVQGGKDYRVPDGQAFEAFQAAQLKGLKSRLLYFPNENHWVLHVQNGLVWQREFFRWLDETL